MLDKEEMQQEFEMFLNEKGMFYAFKDYIESKGYSLSEFGMSDED